MKARHSVVILIVALLAGIAVWFFIERIWTSRLPEVRTGSSFDLSRTFEIPADSMLRKLDRRAVLLLRLDPQAITPVVSWMEDFIARLLTSKAGQKLGLIEKIQGALGQDLQDRNAIPFEKRGLAPMLKPLDEILIAVLNPASQSEALPAGMLAVTFRDSQATEDFKNIFLRIPQTGTYQVAQTQLSWVRGDESIDFSLTKGESMALYGQARVHEKRLEVTLQAKDSPALSPWTEQADSLVSSDSWKAVEPGFMPNAAAIVYGDGKELYTLIQSLSRKLLGQADENLVEALSHSFASGFKDTEVLAGSLSFEQGIRNRYCMKLRHDSEMKFAYLMHITAEPLPPSPAFMRLISPSTAFAVRSDGAFVLMYIESIRLAFSQWFGEENKELPQMWRRFFDQIDTIKTTIRDLNLWDLGLIVNVTPGSFIPEVGMFFARAKPFPLSDLHTALQQLISVIYQSDAPGIQEAVKLSNDPVAGERLEINLGTGRKISIVPLNASVLIAGITEPFLGAAAQQFSQPQTYLAEDLRQHPNLAGLLESSHVSQYENTSGLIELLKTMASFFLMKDAGSPKFTVQDLSELLEFFNYRRISGSRVSTDNKGLVCGQMLSQNL